MAMFKAMIIGNLGKDAEEREYNGKKFLSFTVAVSEKDKDNQEHTQWINVTTYQLTLKDYLRKGKQVYILGPQKNDVYESKPDIRVYADEIHLLGKKEG